MDRKPENGCELETAACGRSGIRIGIENVVSAEDTVLKDFESDHLHDIEIVTALVSY